MLAQSRCTVLLRGMVPSQCTSCTGCQCQWLPADEGKAAVMVSVTGIDVRIPLSEHELDPSLRGEVPCCASPAVGPQCHQLSSQPE